MFASRVIVIVVTSCHIERRVTSGWAHRGGNTADPKWRVFFFLIVTNACLLVYSLKPILL